ncbi:hypothetical protein P692DRAFT_20234842 [Suillus brevipes Sb2]|nr:hypothetical protein P692DRAFT_20234842 [Suillus brevipes Sb2]
MKHHQHSTMKLTSLATIVLSAAAMTGAEDQLGVMSPIGLPCSHPDTVDCISNFKSLNNGNDIGIFCGSQGTIIAYKACACKNCCAVSTSDRFSFVC